MRPVKAIAGLLIALASLSGCTLNGVPSTGAEAASSESAETVSVEFVRVIDGDTVAVKPAGGLSDTGYGEHSVRLLGVDAPEMHKTSDEDPDCGAQAATDHLAELIGDQSTVTLTFDPVSDRTDRYGRSLAYVSVGDHDLNLEQAVGGFAEAWYPSGEPAPGRYASYSTAEKLAKGNGSGSWGTCGSLGR